MEQVMTDTGQFEMRTLEIERLFEGGMRFLRQGDTESALNVLAQVVAAKPGIPATLPTTGSAWPSAAFAAKTRWRSARRRSSGNSTGPSSTTTWRRSIS